MLVASHCRTLRGRPWVLGVLLAGCLLWASIGVLSGEVAASSRGASVAPAVTLTQRGPILIQRNQDFTTANGVTGGSGTAAKPYTISGWQFVDSYVNQIVIENTTAYFVIEDVYVLASMDYADIILDNVTHGTVLNAQLFGGYGTLDFSVTDSAGILVSGNSFTGVRVGASGDTSLRVTNNTGGAAFVDTSSNVLIDHNNPGGDDVRVSGTAGVTVDNNTMGAGGIFIDTSSNVVVTSNDLAASASSGIILQYCQLAKVANNVLLSRGYTGITVNGGTGTTIANNTVTGASQGITVAGDHQVILANTINASSDSGLLLVGTNLTVGGNRFSRDGVLLQGAPLANLATITITADNLVNGLPVRYYQGCANLKLDRVVAGQILVANCRNPVVANVTLSYTQAPLQFYNVTGGWIIDSNFTHNGGNSATIQNDAIYIANSAYINITRNNFRDNNQGAVALDTDTYSTVWHNNFVTHGTSGVSYDSGGSGDAWDDGYPAGGNFWSYSTLVDRCSGPLQNICTGPDGIGDTPVGPDRYPLMRPWDVVAPAPVANFTAPASIFLGDGATVDASASYDAYGFIQTWFWEFGDGTTWNISWASTTHFYSTYGRYRVNLTVTDNLGMANTTSRWVTVTGYPVALFSFAPNPGVMNLPMVFNGTGSSDAFGTIVNYTWYFSFGLESGYRYGAVVTFTPVNQTGGFGALLTVTDNRSVTGQSSQGLSVVQDTQAPTTSLAASGTRGHLSWYISPVTVTLTAQDALSGVASTGYRLDGGPWTIYAGPLVLHDGVHTLVYHSTDRVGNVEANRTATISIDTVLPSLHILSPSGPVPAGSVRVSWAASDNGSGMGSYRLSVDGGPFQDVGSNTSANLTLSQGDHNVTVRAFDVAGNMAEAQQHVVVTEAEVVGGTESIPFLAVGVVVAAAAVALAAYIWRRRHRPPEAREGGQQ